MLMIERSAQDRALHRCSRPRRFYAGLVMQVWPCKTVVWGVCFLNPHKEVVMRAKGLWSFALVVLLAGAALGQGPEGYLDSYIVKVKPEKRADLDGIVKKMVDANRRHKGDNWLASEVIYGEGNTIAFTSPRQNYAGTEKGFVAFMAALNEALGPAGSAKVNQDFNNSIVSWRAEVRRRRPDLSSNVPADMAAMNKLIGQSRWTRSV